MDSHSSRRTVTGTLKQPTRTRRGPRHEVPIWSCSRWGLPCRSVTGLAVRSYRTISPLPACLRRRRRYLSVALVRRLAPPRRYLAPCPMEPGLSSASRRTEMRWDDATVWPAPPCVLSHVSPSEADSIPLSGHQQYPRKAAFQLPLMCVSRHSQTCRHRPEVANDQKPDLVTVLQVTLNVFVLS